MAKSAKIQKFVNGEIADADEVNQAIEDAGAEGGVIPYDPATDEKDTTGSQSLGNTSYPFGSLKVNQDAEFEEVDASTGTKVTSVLWKNLRRFLSLKDVPNSFSGQAEKYLRVNSGESAVEFVASPEKSALYTSSGSWVCPAGVSTVFVTLVGGGGGGCDGGGSLGGGGGGGGATILRSAVKVTAGNTYSPTIGSAGSRVAPGASASNGGSTSFAGDNTTVTAAGGSGANSVNGAAGAPAVTTTLDASGATPGKPANSEAGGNGATAGTVVGAGGGGSYFGVGGGGGADYTNASAVTGYGGGGGGGGRNANGSNGGGGMIYLEW